MLCATRVACFCTGPYTVEELRSTFQVKAQSLEMVVPVGVLDDDLHFRVYLLGGLQNQFRTGFGHEVYAVLGPALFPFSLDFDVGLAACEEEVVENEIIEMLCCMLCYLAYFLAVVGV